MMIDLSGIWDNLISAAVGAGGVGSIFWWKLDKRKKAADVKQDEIEVIRKIIEEVYKPTIEYQNEELGKLREKVTLQDKEIAELRGMVKDCTDSRSECHKMLATLKDEIARLQRSRDNRGRYAKEPRIQKTEKDGTAS